MTTLTQPQSQPMQALALGNELRVKSARVKREIRALPRGDGFRRCAELLLDPPPCVESMRTGQLLGSIHQVGTKAIGTLIKRSEPARPIQHRRIRSLTLQERARLAHELREEADRYEERKAKGWS